jgi:uncharacterized membrane protein
MLKRKLKSNFTPKDVVEIFIGAVILALPISVTEEVWQLGSELAVWRTAIISVMSILFVAFFGFYKFYDGSLQGRATEFITRVFTVYFVANLVALIGLLVIDKLPLIEDPVVAINRIILVAFPACFSATIVDSLR